MLEQINNGNIVRVEGILSEVDLEKTTMTKNGITSNVIRGSFKVRVDTMVGDEPVVLEIPIKVFSTEYTKENKLSAAYEQLTRLKDEFVSIAASDIDHADRVRVGGATLNMNEYYNKNGQFISFPQVMARFVSKVPADKCHPEASFAVTCSIGKMAPVYDAEGIETGDYCITALVPQYGGKVDVVPIIARNRGVVEAVTRLWSEGQTVVAKGRLNFTSRIESVVQEVAFGTPETRTRTVSVSELILTSGSDPLEGDFAIDADELQKALVERKARLAELKEKDSGASKAAPKAAPKKFVDIDF